MFFPIFDYFIQHFGSVTISLIDNLPHARFSPQLHTALRKVIQRLNYPLEVMLMCVRWYVAYPLSLRLVEEMMHETDIKVAGQWKYLYRAVDKFGDTVDFLLTAKRDQAAARRFLERAINLHDVPHKITIDKSGANTAAIERVKAAACVDIELRQNKYLNNIVEQDHRAIKRITGPMLGFKSFWSARIIIAGIETMPMIKKGQLDCPIGSTVSAPDHFYSLAY